MPRICRLPSAKAVTGCLFPSPAVPSIVRRVLDHETSATCKDIAAKPAYAEELKANKAKELYNKMRNRYQMRCSRAPGNQKMRDDYNAWRKQAQMALSKYQFGEISWEEFNETLRSSMK